MLEIFAVLDKVAKAYMNPFYFRNKGEAHRSFEDATKDSKTVMFTHPSDYDLYSIGKFDPTTGVITCTVPGELVCRGSDFIYAK